MDLIFELHSTLTKGTKAENAQGRLRKDSDDIDVHGPIGDTQYITHVPPDENFVKSEIKKLIDFANDKEVEDFTHPVIKAILLHFWIGYLHPFTDGNGRLARSLFHWYLLRKGYRTMMYLPISTVIKKAPAQYAMAYIHTEQDNSDLTYFYDFHIKKIMQAIKDTEEYIERKKEERDQLEKKIGENIRLNDRQKIILRYLLSRENLGTSIDSHSRSNHISRLTARKDLKELEAHKLIFSKREGKYVRYYASDKLRDLNKS